MRVVWFICGAFSVLIGILGIFLPLLPTVPLLLLGAFCFARSSQSAHDWLVNHPRLGPPIQDWNRRGAIRRPAKIAATVAITVGITISIVLKVPVWAFVSQILVLAGVLVFIWSRPNE